MLITSARNVNVGTGVSSTDTAMAVSEDTLKKIDNADVTIASTNGAVAVNGALDLTGSNDYIRNLTLSSGLGGSVQINSASRVNGTLALNAGVVTADAAIDADALSVAANSLDLNATVTANRASIEPASAGYHIELGAAACGNMTSCLLVRDIRFLKVPTLVIGSQDAGLDVAGIAVTGVFTTGTSPGQRDPSTTSIALLSHSGTITQTGTIDVENLAVANGGGITLTNAGNRVSNLAVSQGGPAITLSSRTTATSPSPR